MEIFKPWLEVSSVGVQNIGRSPYGSVSILSDGVSGAVGLISGGQFVPISGGALEDQSIVTIDVGVGRELWINVTGGAGTISTSHVESQSAGSQSAEIQTRVETLNYASTAVEGVSFTHNRVQGATSTNVFVEPITVVKRNLGGGLCDTKIYCHLSYIGSDSTFNIELPTGTITTPYIDVKRAFRDELNVLDYVIATTTQDSIAVNRDDNISGNSPCYLETEGVGNW